LYDDSWVGGGTQIRARARTRLALDLTRVGRMERRYL